MKNIHIAIASCTSRPGDVAANLKQVAEFAEIAGRVGADVLLTPELSASGYGSYPEVLLTAESAGNGPIYEALAQAAQKAKLVLCAGFVERAGDDLYLSHYAIYPEGAFVVQRKNYVVPSERPLKSSTPSGVPVEDTAGCTWAGDAIFNVFEIGGVRCALAICADFRIAKDKRIFPPLNVELLLAPAGAGGSRDARVVTDDLKREEGRQRYVSVLEQIFFPKELICHCMEYRTALAAVNLCGYDGQKLYHAGHGAIVTASGEIAAFLPGQPNLDWQRPTFAHATIGIEGRLP